MIEFVFQWLILTSESERFAHTQKLWRNMGLFRFDQECSVNKSFELNIVDWSYRKRSGCLEIFPAQ